MRSWHAVLWATLVAGCACDDGLDHHGDLFWDDDDIGWPADDDDLGLPPGPVGALPTPGDHELLLFEGGAAQVPLTDGSFDLRRTSDPAEPDDFAARFLLLLVNPSEEEAVYEVTATDPPAEQQYEGWPPPAPLAEPDPAEPPDPVGCVPDLGPGQVHNTDILLETPATIDLQTRFPVGVSLAALGDTVAIWMDHETPIDFDPDCEDPDNPVQLSDLPAFGFSNCHVQRLADTIDANLHPTLTAAFGPLPDVHQDCRFDVMITHRLNRLALTDDDIDDHGELVETLVQPEVDLFASSLDLNPESNERELIWILAPDEIGFWNTTTLSVQRWSDLVAPAAVATSMQRLISFGRLVGASDSLLQPGNPAPPPQDDWLDDGLAAAASDLTGFGARHHADAWHHLDGADLEALTRADELAWFQRRGGQYLFARWLWDVWGSDGYHALMVSELRGRAAVTELTGRDLGEVVLDEATALSLSGMQGADGLPLLDHPSLPLFADPSTSTAVGADGYQLGFALRGENQTCYGGADPEGCEPVPELAVRTSGIDHRLFHPQTGAAGTLSGDLGVAAILVDGLDSESWLRVETAGGEDLVGRVVRLPDADPHAPRLTLEDIGGALATDARELWPFPEPGQERNLIGHVDAEETVDLADGGVLAVADTDRYAFTLVEPATVGVWVDRRVADLAGEATLTDPFVLVSLHQDLPDAADPAQWNFGPDPADGPCADPSLFAWPAVIPDWLAAQAVLIPDPTVASWAPAVGAGPGLDCAVDHDADGIADVDEGWPPTLPAQILQRQAENLLVDPAFYADTFDLAPTPIDVTVPWYDAFLVDADSNEVPPDDEPTAFPAANVGGRSVAGGEEAAWLGWLPAGDWIIVVGSADGSTGPYDLSVRLVE